MPELGPLSHVLAVEIARHCEKIISDSNKVNKTGMQYDYDPPDERPRADHLLKMCEKIENHADEWPVTKLHRWVGFIQGSMVMAGLTTMEKESQFIRDLKMNLRETVDIELKDHRDPESEFELDLGTGD